MNESYIPDWAILEYSMNFVNTLPDEEPESEDDLD